MGKDNEKLTILIELTWQKTQSLYLNLQFFYIQIFEVYTSKKRENYKYNIFKRKITKTTYSNLK